MRRLLSDVCLFVLLPLWLLVGASQAQFSSFPPGTFNSRAALDAPPAGGGPTAFDPAHKSSAITLSGSPALVATATSASNWEVVRATASHSTGKYYAEFTLTALPSPNAEIGIVNASFPIVSGDFIGFDTNSCGYSDFGGVFKGGSSFATVLTYGAGDVIQMAYDAGTGDTWFTKDGSSWNNTGANPAIGTGGLACGLAGVAVFPAVTVFANGQVWTANFGGSAYSFTPPAGFGNW